MNFITLNTTVTHWLARLALKSIPRNTLSNRGVTVLLVPVFHECMLRMDSFNFRLVASYPSSLYGALWLSVPLPSWGPGKPLSLFPLSAGARKHVTVSSAQQADVATAIHYDSEKLSFKFFILYIVSEVKNNDLFKCCSHCISCIMFLVCKCSYTTSPHNMMCCQNGNTFETNYNDYHRTDLFFCLLWLHICRHNQLHNQT